MPKNARLFVVSGPSGAGKGTLVASVRKLYPSLSLTVSATTRSPRDGEIDGVSYYFLSDEVFTQKVEAGEFLEWAQVFDHRYGTLVSEVKRLLSLNSSVILEIDVQGALQVREKIADAVLIFIEPPSFSELEQRLRNRGTETEEAIQLRLSIAHEEMQLKDKYDVCIVNDSIERATAELAHAITSYELYEKE